ncbi:MAG: matrixin family metalloprotease [Acidobacteriia bacterium]|nr:matrixin family metalloprotease [Terriglobia bacterium]
MSEFFKKTVAAVLAFALALFSAQTASAYTLHMTVADLRLSSAVVGTSACPVPAHRLTAAGSFSVQWSTSLGASPLTVLTQDQTAAGRLNEIEKTIQQSLGVWTGVSGSVLLPGTLAPLARVSSSTACAADGLNSICFNQSDAGFTPGILAFTRVITADHLGAQLTNGPAATEIGEILDADVYFNPGDPNTTFATPQALAANPAAYDLESLLTHELGHAIGFSHSAVWRAMMAPYAPAPGTFTGQRPTTLAPDAPLAEDDRTGLRALYPDPSDTVHTGSISGRILPANALSLPAVPAGVSGIFGAHVVALDAASGNVVAGVLGGWSCSGTGPAQFDGSYRIERLAVGAS